jgi:hypothetical protein
MSDAAGRQRDILLRKLYGVTQHCAGVGLAPRAADVQRSFPLSPFPTGAQNSF